MNYDRKVAITLAALRLAQVRIVELNNMPMLAEVVDPFIDVGEIDELCEEANVEAPKVITVIHTHRHGVDVHHAMMAVGEEVPDDVDVVDFLGIEFESQIREEEIEIHTYEVSNIPRLPPTYKRGTPIIKLEDLPEVDKIVVLSTAHIKKSDSDILDSKAKNTVKPVIADDYEYGHWVCLMEEVTTTDIVNEGYSHAFAALYTGLREMGFKWLRLDCDGPECETLPTFDWESE